MKKRHIRSIIFYSLLTLVILVSIAADHKAWKEKETDLLNSIGPPPLVLTTVEEFEIADLSGNQLSSAQINQGDTMLILWSLEDAGTSEAFFNRLNELSEEGKYQGITILPVNIGNKAKEVKSFFEEKGYTFTSYMDVDHTVKWAFNKSSIMSYVYLLDSQGIIRIRQGIGAREQNDWFLSKINKYLER